MFHMKQFYLIILQKPSNNFILQKNSIKRRISIKNLIFCVFIFLNLSRKFDFLVLQAKNKKINFS